jgi:hypothetical protein
MAMLPDWRYVEQAAWQICVDAICRLRSLHLESLVCTLSVLLSEVLEQHTVLIRPVAHLLVFLEALTGYLVNLVLGQLLPALELFSRLETRVPHSEFRVASDPGTLARRGFWAQGLLHLVDHLRLINEQSVYVCSLLWVLFSESDPLLEHLMPT